MRNRVLSVAIVATAVALAGCEGPVTKRFDVDEASMEAEAQLQREQFVEAMGRDILNYREIGWNVLTRAAALCEGRLTDTIGVVVWDSSVFDPLTDNEAPYREAAGRVFGLGETPSVVAVFPGSPAARAGVRPGDVVVGIRVPSSDAAGADGDDEGASSRWSDHVGRDTDASQNPVTIDPDTLAATRVHTFRIERDGQTLDLSMRPVARCDYGLKVANNDEMNALADGENIVVDLRFMRWLENDDLLAVTVGHELAHNQMGHIEKSETNATAGALLGGVLDLLFAANGVNTGGDFSKVGAYTGASAYSPEFESEADYVGLYATAMAGYDISQAPQMWRRMSTLGTRGIEYTTSHPRNPYRAKALEATLEEIESKRVAGEVLRPERKAEASNQEQGE